MIDAERKPSRRIFYIVAVSIFLVLALAALRSTVNQPPGTRIDFGSFVASGRAVVEGRDPYAEVSDPSLTPPFTLPVLAGLARTEPYLALLGWRLTSFALYALSICLLIRAYPHQNWLLHVAWALALQGLWLTLRHGQVYAVIAPLSTLTWIALKNHQAGVAGIMLGLLCAFKPNFLLWPALLFLAGHRRVAVTALCTMVSVSVLPLLLYNPQVYVSWIAVLGRIAGKMTGHITEISLAGVAKNLELLGLGPAIALALAAGLAYWSLRRRPSPLAVSAYALPGILLVSPITWLGYSVVLLPVFFSRRWTLGLSVAAGLLALPPGWLFRLAGGDMFHVIYSVYTVALLTLLAAVVASSPDETAGVDTHDAVLSRLSPSRQ